MTATVFANPVDLIYALNTLAGEIDDVREAVAGGGSGGGSGGSIFINDGEVVSNISGAGAVAIGNPLSAVFDHDLGAAQGDIIYRNASVWTTLSAGTAGQSLVTGGPAADPSWATAGATVNNVIPILDAHGSPIADSAGYLGSVTGPVTDVWDASAWWETEQLIIGSYLVSDVPIASKVSLTTATPADVTSIVLTEGEWDISGTVAFDPDATTTVSDQIAAISVTSATLPTLGPGEVMARNSSPATVGVGAVIPTGTCVQTVAVATTLTVYLVAQATFAVSTNDAYGFIRARRIT